MDRRLCLYKLLSTGSTCAIFLSGCRGHQYAHVLKDKQPDMVGSHTAGAETFNPLVGEAVAKLLGRHEGPETHMTGHVPAGELPVPAAPAGKKSICFVGIENKSIEELGDFKDQLYEQIDAQIVSSNVFDAINRRFVETGLRETRLRPDSLFVHANMQEYAAVMHQMGKPFDYLLFAKITSGTTQDNKNNYQRDYQLTLELINVHTGQYDKQMATVRKGYHRSRLGALKNYNPFRRN
ncbi:MAG: penicillin-binding protein activator LpoB [Planctomycetaceae bacterium]|nr:penicillin-binding protein activator LpoB [Planctomycetaceae bacterium]